MKHYLRLTALCIALMALLTACNGAHKQPQELNPQEPTNITIWHYYNGMQQMAFNRLVEEFNQTEGESSGIYVQAHSQGNVQDLEKAVLASFERTVGSMESPDVFSSYADTAYAIEKMDKLVDLEPYLTSAEIASYAPSFIEEGRIGQDGRLRIFPVAKGSEVLMINKTAWEPFAKATGATLDRLETMEGLAEIARDYYQWTDALTPDVPHDGQAFYGRDAMANLFLIGSMQLGIELFAVQDGQAVLRVDDAAMRRIWDTYYVPYISGYFSAYGRFRSDDLKIGEIIAYTGSTSSSSYFPDAIDRGGQPQSIDYLTLPAPLFSGGAAYAVQQGAGMVVAKSTPARELASVTFLKWFTQEENNIRFCAASGYMPVKTAAMDKDVVRQTISAFSLEIEDKVRDTIFTSLDMLDHTSLYMNKAFDHGAAARSVLDNHLHQKAVEDREEVCSRLAQGQSLAEATADLTGDQAFRAWLASFKDALNEAAYPSSSQKGSADD